MSSPWPCSQASEAQFTNGSGSNTRLDFSASAAKLQLRQEDRGRRFYFPNGTRRYFSTRLISCSKQTKDEKRHSPSMSSQTSCFSKGSKRRTGYFPRY